MTVQKTTSPLQPGIYLVLEGQEAELNDWRALLREPSEPEVLYDPHQGVLLRSRQFAQVSGDDEIRAIATGLVDRLNGIINVLTGAQAVSFLKILTIEPDGTRTISIKISNHRVYFGRAQDADVPRQEFFSLNDLTGRCHDIGDMLEEFGRIDGWYGIYKTMERAESVLGGVRKLREFLGDDGAESKRMRSTANYYRHTQAYRPDPPMDYGDAYILVRKIVTKILTDRQSIEH